MNQMKGRVLEVTRECAEAYEKDIGIPGFAAAAVKLGKWKIVDQQVEQSPCKA